MGYSRQQFYEIRRNFQTYGTDGLADRVPGARGPHPNRVSEKIEQAVLAHALDYPCHGAVPVEQELRLQGIQVSAGGVRGDWQRRNLLTKHERLLRLEKQTAERKMERALIQEYRDSLDAILARGLTPERLAVAVDIARIPEEIRGYGHVKERHVKAARAKWDALTAQWKALA